MTTQFLSRNYSNSSLVANVTVTSEATGFPKENVINFTRRTKVWRSGGYFLVETGSNTIVFEETNGVPLTATITAGGHSSFSALATEIKTQLEAAGGSTYTVSQDTTTLKAKIVSDGSGGGGVFTLKWTSAGAIGGILGFDTSADDSGALTYLADSLRISTGESFVYDFGIPLNPDAVVVSWRQDEPSSLNETSVLTVKGNYTNNFSSSVVFSGTAAKTDYGFFLKKVGDADGLASNGQRYWQIAFDDIDNPNGYMEIGSIFIGEFIDFTRGSVQIPFNGSWEDGTIRQVTDSGQLLTTQKYLTRVFDANWFGLTKAEKEEFDEFFEEVRTAEPFYIMLDPNSVLGSTVERNLIYARFESAPTWSMEFPGVYTLSTRMREDI